MMLGTLIRWSAVTGWGFIRSGNRVFFAHASQFLPQCGCDQIHKCQVNEGNTVEFEQSPVDQTGRYPPATRIRVLP